MRNIFKSYQSKLRISIKVFNQKLKNIFKDLNLNNNNNEKININIYIVRYK